jgi:hypothetical protein
LADEVGPWLQYDLIDGDKPGDIVGVRRKDCPNEKIFTPIDMLALENPNIDGLGRSGTKGAVIVHLDGRVEPNTKATKSHPFDENKYTDASII